VHDEIRAMAAISNFSLLFKFKDTGT
jgi:hypothetical protein